MIINFKIINRFIAKSLPWSGLIISVLLLIFLYCLSKYELANKGLYVVIPLLCVGLVHKKMTDNKIDDNFSLLFNVWFVRSSFIFYFFIYFSFIIRFWGDAVEARSCIYYFLIIVAICIVLFKILFFVLDKIKVAAILFDLIVLSLNIIYGIILRYPFYLGGGDIAWHMGAIRSLIEKGSISTEMGFYKDFPLFHVLNAINIKISSIGLENAYYVLGSLILCTSILLIFLIIYKTTNSYKISLLGALFYSLSRVFLNDAMYVTTRSVAFVFCLFMLYIILRRVKNYNFNIKMNLLLLIFVFAAIFEHQSTIFFFCIVFASLSIIEKVLYKNCTIFNYRFVLMLGVATISYWMYVAKHFWGFAIKKIFMPNAFIHIQQQQGLELPLYHLLLRYLDIDIIIFCVLIGSLVIFNKNKLSISLNVMSIFGLIALLIYIPGPSELISNYALTYRLPLLFSPFVMLLASFGIASLYVNLIKKKVSGAVCFALLFAVYACFSLGVGITNEMPFLNFKNDEYFINSEINALNFIAAKGHDKLICSDYQCWRFLQHYLDVKCISNAKHFKYIPENKMILLLRKHELNSNGILQFYNNNAAGYYDKNYFNLNGLANKQNIIYSNFKNLIILN